MKPPLSMQIFGKTVTPAPILYKDKVFVPLRAVGQALGYQVNYGTKSKTMDLISKTHKVTVTVGYINASVNGKSTKMDLAPVLSKESLYVPMSFVQKNFNYAVAFSADKNMVTINKPGTVSNPPAATTPAPTTTTPKPAVANGIFVMDKKVNTTEKAMLKGGIVYIPVRLVGENLGYEVNWSPSTKTMTLTKQNQSMAMVENKTSATVNKTAVKLDGAPFLSGGRLYAPLTIVSKNLGLAANYDSKQNQVTINQKPVEVPKPPVTPAPQVPVNKPGVANVVNIAYDESGGFPQVNISADSAIASYNAFTMDNPNRLVIDINSAEVRTEAAVKEIQQAGLYRVRIAKKYDDPTIARVVVDLDKHMPYKIVQSEDKKTISVLYANVITPISYQKEGDMDVIVVNGTSALDTSFMELDNPDRIVLDVKRAVFDDLLQSIPATSSILKTVRIGQFDVGTARVVLDVVPDTYFKVKTEGNTSKIYLSSYPFEFVEYKRYFNTSVLNLSPGKEVSYEVSVDSSSNTVNVVIPQDLKLATKRVDINDNLVKYVDYKTELQNGSNVTIASIKMQDSIESKVISGDTSKLIKVQFQRKITSFQQLTVVVDAGHGGKDPGAVASDGTREKDLNLEVAKKLEKYLNAMGFKTIMTRKDDTFVELGGRTDIANLNYADFFISVHFNAFNKTTNGIETLYYPNTVSEEYTVNHRKVADIFHQEVVSATGRGSRGINARPNLYVLNKTKMPAILSELGFMTNPEELALMKTDKYKEDAARALAVSILKYFRDMQGVYTDIDPFSIYTWPYEEQVVQTQEIQEIQQETIEAVEQTTEAPINEEAAVQP
jgi:N-acetylmuramoyl-L-alanine amidase